MVDVAQSVEHQIVVLRVVGSIPIIHPIFLSLVTKYVEQEPLAQLVEHLTFNQGVPRSSRGWLTKKDLTPVVESFLHLNSYRLANLL